MQPVTVLVEVDLALTRPPKVDAQVWVSVLIEERRSRTSIEADAEEVAMCIAMCDRRVVMAVGARVIDFDN